MHKKRKHFLVMILILILILIFPFFQFFKFLYSFQSCVVLFSFFHISTIFVIKRFFLLCIYILSFTKPTRSTFKVVTYTFMKLPKLSSDMSNTFMMFFGKQNTMAWGSNFCPKVMIFLLSSFNPIPTICCHVSLVRGASNFILADAI